MIAQLLRSNASAPVFLAVALTASAASIEVNGLKLKLHTLPFDDTDMLNDEQDVSFLNYDGAEELIKHTIRNDKKLLAMTDGREAPIHNFKHLGQTTPAEYQDYFVIEVMNREDIMPEFRFEGDPEQYFSAADVTSAIEAVVKDNTRPFGERICLHRLMMQEYKELLAYMGAAEVEEAKAPANVSKLSPEQIAVADKQYDSFLDKVMAKHEFSEGKFIDAVNETVRTDDEFGELLVGRALSRYLDHEVLKSKFNSFESNGEILHILRKKIGSREPLDKPGSTMRTHRGHTTEGEFIVGRIEDSVHEYLQGRVLEENRSQSPAYKRVRKVLSPTLDKAAEAA